MLHFFIDRSRELPDAILAAMLAEGIKRFGRRSHSALSPPPSHVIEVPFIESRTKVFGLGE